MSGLTRDLRFALRRLLRSPGLVAILLLTVGLGTGANSVVVSAARTLLFEPPAGVLQPRRLAHVYTRESAGGYRGLSRAAFDRLRSAGLFEQVLASRDDGRALLSSGEGTLVEVGIAAVSTIRTGESGASMGTHGKRTRAALVVTQIALSSVLLVLSGVLTGALRQALWSKTSGPARRVAAVSVSAANYDRLAGLALTVPGVADAGWIGTLPLLRLPRRDFGAPVGGGANARREVAFNIVSDNYFALMGLPIREGRPFDRGDGFRSPRVVIVNDVLARAFFGGDAVGRTLAPSSGAAVTIIGVVPAVRYRALEPPPVPTVYYPMRQLAAQEMSLVARTLAPPATVLDPILQSWADAQASPHILRALALEDHLSSVLAVDRVARTLLGATGLLALLLTTVGVYGVMADTVLRRSREIGVCAALGARPREIVGLVLAGGLKLTVVGTVAGLAAGMGAWRLLGTTLDGVGPIDREPFIATAGLVLLMSLVAALAPARRALRVDPLAIMRQE